MQYNNRVIATSAVGIITEALRQIVPDVGLRVRRTFAYDEHMMTPIEFVRSLMTFSTGGFNAYTTRGVGYLLVPMVTVFAPMTPGEASGVNVLVRRLAFLETCVKYTHQFYRETIAREMETAPLRDVDDGAPALVKRISELCLQLLDEEAMVEALSLFWLESQHQSTASVRTVHELSSERLIWSVGSDRFSLTERGLAWAKNGQYWFSSTCIDGTEHTLRYLPQTLLGAQLADAAREVKPALSVVT
ncbi:MULTISPECIES: hypothetical protein [Xanthomonas]|uniref:Uncharacterized protein n=1 Tax=Xanthomonas euvesicatoria TaxID=456327 RepID=A0AAX4FQI2_XANEU|nr:MULTISPECIES: hypothetical protein [Xanthomonas]QYF47682.1 hypothetical protein HZS93_07240 [Xanthomonas citri]WOP50491.1 hypothetical protein R2B60_21485 [Xanthomonas euvesicatoria]WOP54665.1 hypothetical protein R5576_21355 [Xanthomonas euvesicatoria]WOP58837.1 hypothetical protein R5577_22595 [Xanthomonas euvesicatoria]